MASASDPMNTGDPDVVMNTTLAEAIAIDLMAQNMLDVPVLVAAKVISGTLGRAYDDRVEARARLAEADLWRQRHESLSAETFYDFKVERVAQLKSAAREFGEQT